MTSPYDNAGDDSIAGQQHRVMMMIAHAINNSQNGITIGGLHFQLSNETENNNNGNITADGGDVQGENNIVTANMSGGTAAQLFAGIMANSQNGINSSYQEDENQRNDYNDWAANEADGDGDDHDDNYYDMYETGNLGIEGVNYEREDEEEEEENGFEEEEGDGEGGDDDNVSLS